MLLMQYREDRETGKDTETLCIRQPYQPYDDRKETKPKIRSQKQKEDGNREN